MNADSSKSPERLDDLLIDRATGGLSRNERIELEALIAADPGLDDDSFELLTASLDLALDGHEEPIPSGLRASLESDAELFWSTRLERTTAPTTQRRAPAPRRRVPLGRLGWVAAAVLAVLAWFGWRAGEPVPPTLEPRDVRSHVIADATDLKQWSWQGLEDPTVGSLSGDVVWSDDLQEGAMLIGGLAVNDPSEFQYQLWIFDRTRDERFPVDGGVFDVPSGGGQVVVPIRASLPVDDAYLFAVTVEAPGGVVVSSRERIAILAQPPAEG